MFSFCIAATACCPACTWMMRRLVHVRAKPVPRGATGSDHTQLGMFRLDLLQLNEPDETFAPWLSRIDAKHTEGDAPR